MDYFVYKDDQQLGPYDEAALLSMLAANQIQPADLIWNEQLPNWTPVESIFPAPAPAPAPVTPAAGTPASKSGTTEKPIQNDKGNKSGLLKTIGIAAAILSVIGIILWFFVFRGEPETEDSKIIKTAIRKSINKPSGGLSQNDYDQVKALDLSAKGLSDISLLEKLKYLEELKLGGNKVQNLTPISDLSLLKKLDLSGNGISNLAAINSLTSLQELSLGGNAISDISPLSNIKALKALDVGNNKIENLEPLSGLPSLEVINLAQNNVASLAPLKGLKSLKMLIVSGNANIKDPDIADLKTSLPNCSIQE
jgi:Leucine-rich repeat (LRR) protein